MDYKMKGALSMDTTSHKNIKRIAVMGGTFDPIHYGHLVAAEAVRDQYNIERVIFMPTGHPPHKKDRKITDPEHRYLMSILATETNPYFFVSRVEIDREGYTYTIDTIKELKNIYGKDTEIFFITGADAFLEILTWKRSDELLTLCNFIAATRPEYDKDELIAGIEKIKGDYASRFHFIDIPALSISSTDIRQRVETGRTIKYLLPEAVEQHIYKYGLYHEQGKEEANQLEMIKDYVKRNLSPKRMQHTMGVVDMAKELGKAYNCTSHKCEMAALLHDIAKEIKGEERQRLCQELCIDLDSFSQFPQVLHGFLGAEMAKAQFGITDEEILDAIRYHTTGRQQMSLLEKIIFIADYIEEGRSSIPSILEARKEVFNNLDTSVLISLESTMRYLENKGVKIHPLTMEAYVYYKEAQHG